MKLKSSPNSKVVFPSRLRPKAAAQMVPCSLGTLYKWMGEQKFKSWSINTPGKNRGVRFIDGPTFEKFLDTMQQGAGV